MADDAPPGLQEDRTSNLKQANEELLRKNEALKEQMAMMKQNADLAKENAQLQEQNSRLMMNPHAMMPPFGAPPMGFPPFVPGDPFMDPSMAWGMPYMGSARQSWGGNKWSDGHKGKGGGKVTKRSTWNGPPSRPAGNWDVPRTSTASSRGSVGARSEPADTEGDEAKAARIRLREKLVGKPEHRGPQTTAMMRNIPPEYTRQNLLELVDSAGFQGKYDFVYLPIEFKRDVNLGYAFINFTNHDDAVAFSNHFQNFTSWFVESDKVCEVSWSDVIQGFQDHVERYQNSPVMHESVPDDFKPVLFRDGKRIPFPAPTKKIRQPKQSKKDRDDKSSKTAETKEDEEVVGKLSSAKTNETAEDAEGAGS